MKKLPILFLLVAASFAAFAGPDYPIKAADIKDVTVTGGFWLPRFETNRLVTVRADFEKCEIAPDVFRSRYSNGEEVVCNYTDKPFSYRGESVAPLAYRLYK